MGLNWKEYKKQKKLMYQKQKEIQQIKKLNKDNQDKNIEKQDQDCKQEFDENSEQGRRYTISIAVPGSILDNAQSAELRTYLAGQVARAAAVFNVDEIIVFDETGITSHSNIQEADDLSPRLNKKGHGCIQLIRILQYLECPQYLRKYFFPIHSDLEYAGLLNPLDIPHHQRIDDHSLYREGIVLKKPVKEGKGSYVYIGLHKTARIDKALQSNIRVTVKLDEEQIGKKHLKGRAVPPNTPCREAGLYWGYSVRLAKSLGTVFTECPFKEGYDVTIGTSERGNSVDSVTLKPFKHLLLVFGGLKGLEASLDADETLEVDDPSVLFKHYLNTCPSQGSRTIRTEEAILISLSILRPRILEAQQQNFSTSVC